MCVFKKSILITLLLLVSSCFLINENGIDFKIKNNSDLPITNIKFYTTEKLVILKIDKIESNDSISEFLSMKNNKSDGEYILEFTRADGVIETKRCGYYTNGSALDKWVKFNVEKDTTFIKFSETGY